MPRCGASRGPRLRPAPRIGECGPAAPSCLLLIGPQLFPASGHELLRRCEKRSLVLIELPGAGRDSYSDGPAEDRFIAALGSGETAAGILANDRSWPALYHFSETRRNLLEWFPFSQDSRVLEVGAGCGALTGLLCEHAREVTALELSRKRAEIIRLRHESRPNLTIAVGNVQDLPLHERFDVATLVGVLEYAPRFTPGADPAAALLEIVAGHLTPGGALVIAIENRFGLKYWAGAPEDHTGAPFDGLEGYLRHGWVRTFSRHELEELLRRAGFPAVRFFYPMPDYKLPDAIYSDARQVAPGEIARAFPSWDSERLRLFDERAVLDGVAGSGAFPFFANSFLVVARRGGVPANGGVAPEDMLFARYSRDRLPDYRIETRIAVSGGETIVRKRALEASGRAHIAAIVRNHAALQALTGPLRVPPATLNHGAAEVAYVSGSSLEAELEDALLRRNAGRALATVDLFAGLLRAISVPSEETAAFGDDGTGGPMLASGIVDINLDNLIRDEAGLWWLIDVEWCRGEPVATDFVLARGLEHIVWKRHDLVAGVLDPQRLFDRVGIDAARRSAFQAHERSFQRSVRGDQPAFSIDPAFERSSRTLGTLEQERRDLAASFESERAARCKIEAELARLSREAGEAFTRGEERERSYRELEADIQRIRGSRAWRVVSMYYAAWRRLGRR